VRLQALYSLILTTDSTTDRASKQSYPRKLFGLWRAVYAPGDGQTVRRTLVNVSLREEFFRLYEQCVANGSTARGATYCDPGISLSCRLRDPPSSTPTPVTQCRRLWNMTMCDETNHVAAAPTRTAPLVSKPSPPELSGPENSPPDHPTPESLLPRYSPIPSLPPAKQTRKAVKRQCEAELLRNEGEEDTLLLSPLHDSNPPPALSPLSMPITSPMLRTPLSLSPPEQGPSTQFEPPRSPLRQLLRQQTSLHRRRLLSLRYPRLRPLTRTRSRCSSW
jgi:hypothetical protein